MSETQDQTLVQSTHSQVTASESDPKEMKFRFREDKMGNKRKGVALQVPVPNIAGLIAVINSGVTQDDSGKVTKLSKEVELILENMADTVRSAVSDWVADQEEGTEQAKFNPASFSWTAIANQPKEDRRSSQIPKEDWEAFAKDYIAVMQSAAGKTLDQVTAATTVYLKKFSIVKSNKDVLNKLKDQLTIYVQNSKEATENFGEILELLNTKLDTYLKSDEVQQLVANL